MRQVQCGIPSEIFGLNRHCINGQLNTRISDITHIGIHLTVWINIGRYRIVPYQVGCLLVIELNRTTQSTIQESEIQTHIEHTSAFPLQIRIRILSCNQLIVSFTIVLEATVCIQAIGCYCRISSEAKGITADTITQTQLQLIKDATFHEIFF